MTVHINAPPAVERKIVTTHCPTCKRSRRMLGWLYEWYGWTLTCLGCGDRWTEGEMHERPFRRGWRAQSKASAKARWRRG